MTIVTTDKVSWSEDVLAFARAANVEQYLDPLLEATRELFPTAREIRVSINQDPEIPGLQTIAWDVDVPREEGAELVNLTKQWVRMFMRICPPTHLHFFLNHLHPVS